MNPPFTVKITLRTGDHTQVVEGEFQFNNGPPAAVVHEGAIYVLSPDDLAVYDHLPVYDFQAMEYAPGVFSTHDVDLKILADRSRSLPPIPEIGAFARELLELVMTHGSTVAGVSAALGLPTYRLRPFFHGHYVPTEEQLSRITAALSRPLNADEVTRLELARLKALEAVASSAGRVMRE